MFPRKVRDSFIPRFIVLVVLFFGTVSRQALAEEAAVQAPASGDAKVQEVQDPSKAAPLQTPPVFTPKTGSSKWSDGWYEGSEGYTTAFDEYKKTDKPMAVYISVGWCPYCRKFEKEILSSPAVKEFLKDKLMVNVNPEAGPEENALASHYRVTGFPSFYVHVPRSDTVIRLYTGGSPREFIQQFEEATK